MLLKKNVKSSLLLTRFLTKNILKKPSTYVFVAILLLINIIAAIVLKTTQIEVVGFNIATYLILFINLLIGIIFSTIKAINLFKETQNNGLDILILAKNISRNNFILTKIGFFVFINIIWTFLVFISLLIYFLVNQNNLFNLRLPILYSFLSILFANLIFGFLIILIVNKLSTKITMIIPILTFIPLSLSGSISAIFNKSQLNQLALYFNQPYDKHHSKTILDVEKFFLNNNSNQFYLIPKGLNNFEFDKNQKQFLELAFEKSNSAAKTWQTISWLFLPYQLIDLFTNNDNDLIKNSINQPNHLNDYLYDNKNAGDMRFSYKTNSNANLISRKVKINNHLIDQFIVPGAIKNHSHLVEFENSSIIYLRKNADVNNFNTIFKEDNSLNPPTNNYAGKIKWNIIKQTLESQVFLDYAKQLYASFDLQATKNEILEGISQTTNENYANNFKTLVDNNTILLNEENNSLFSSLIDKKMHFIVALIYYLYFNDQDSVFLDTILKNNKEQLFYTPSIINVKIDDHIYEIGGYEDYVFESKVVNDKTIFRYSATKSNNYLFQTTNEVYEITQDQQIVNKDWYILIWIIILSTLIISVYFVYKRKDYR